MNGNPTASAREQKTLSARSIVPGERSYVKYHRTRKPTESAAKKRQCDRSPKERDECATRASAKEGDNLEWNNNDSTTQPEKRQLDIILAFF